MGWAWWACEAMGAPPGEVAGPSLRPGGGRNNVTKVLLVGLSRPRSSARANGLDYTALVKHAPRPPTCLLPRNIGPASFWEPPAMRVSVQALMIWAASMRLNRQ